MFSFSNFKPTKITRFIAGNERSRKCCFYAGSILAIISQGGLLYVALKKSEKLVFPAVAAGFIGSSLVVLSMHDVKDRDENQRVVEGTLQLMIPPEESNWALNRTNIERSLKYLADDYHNFWIRSSRHIDTSDYRVEFAKAFVDGLVDIGKQNISALKERNPDKSVFDQVDPEFEEQLRTVKNNFVNREIPTEGTSGDECWCELYFDVFNIFKEWSLEYERLSSSG